MNNYYLNEINKHKADGIDFIPCFSNESIKPEQIVKTITKQDFEQNKVDTSLKQSIDFGE
jgi:hypothetical protein